MTVDVSNPPGPIVGIDLGTTNSLVAVLESGKPRVLPNALGEGLTPSVVSVSANGELLVGAAARARLTTAPAQTAAAFKRDMGTAKSYRLGDRSMTPIELSALVLRSLKQDAEAALGQPVTEAVVTVPAYFGDLQRQATRDAGALAGLKVERIVNEPTAAALAYGLHSRQGSSKIAVLDLGGGTFDVTILQIEEGILEILSSAGDARLGGLDFDTALARRVAQELLRLHDAEVDSHPGAWARLVGAAEQVKHRLTNEEATRLVIPKLALGEKRALDVEQEITRLAAEAEWVDLLARMRAPILRALRDSSLKPGEVDEVLLVGGATRMPCVQQLAAQLFGRLPLRTLPPDEAVAMGAAVQAALKEGAASVEDMVVTDIAPFSLGIAAGAEAGGRHVTGVFVPILERGTVIPASRVERFSTAVDFQREVRVEVFQGEHQMCEQNQLIGIYSFKGLPPAPAGEALDVRFTYDLNGILEVELTLVRSGRVESFVIEKQPGRLTPEQLADSRARLAQYKLHPRQALPNTTALSRSDALFMELTGPRRHRLGEAITIFRAALEAQDPVRIQEVREALNALIAELRGAEGPG